MDSLITVNTLLYLNAHTIQVLDTNSNIHTLRSDTHDLNKIISNVRPGVNINLNEYLLSSRGDLNSIYNFYLVDKKDLNNKLPCTFDTIPQENQILIAVKKTDEDYTIPYANKLQKYLLSESQKEEYFKKFLDKFYNIQERLPFTSERLIDFLEKANLPLDKDGNLLGFKKLMKVGDSYRDIHSRSVEQDEGYLVEIDAVDDDCNVACSNGLHVASLEYLQNFGGSDLEETPIFLVKVNIEDIVAVPNYDVTKLRCRKYHILKKLSKEDMFNVNNNINEICPKLLGNMIEGNYPLPHRITSITTKGIQYTTTDIDYIEVKEDSELYADTLGKKKTAPIFNYKELLKKYKGI